LAILKVSSWGRLDNSEHDVCALVDRFTVGQTLQRNNPGIAYGMGRSYGDVCLNPNGYLWLTTGMGRFIDFNSKTGLLKCEAGVVLADIQKHFVPRGWSLPVTPGTQLVTVGGAIANDVHGKNHHRVGSFGNHVHSLKLARTDGQVLECSPLVLPEWFGATVGGLGLTGVITEAEIQLRPIAGPWLNTETIAYKNLKEFFELADASEQKWEHTVSWVDCLARAEPRGIFMRANHTDADPGSEPTTKKRKVPFAPPVSLINKWTLRPFNSTYYHVKKWNSGKSIEHYKEFFHPLDNLRGWNRIYGPRGFFQYQSVVPRDLGLDATKAMLAEIKRAGEGSFLAVLKTFGDTKSLGMLSFPKAGVTLALDFPNNGQYTEKLFERLDAVLREAKGRIYMAKDARMPRGLFEQGYPGFAEFCNYRDPGISSGMSRRLFGG
jgi:FAD/FMN-containing dehydrogenase